VVFRALPEGDESRDELMETVTTDESVVKEYNPYREAELMGELRGRVYVYVGVCTWMPVCMFFTRPYPIPQLYIS
jgi:hypothetical protein